MAGACYITVSNAALCQKCPMLLAYTIHKGIKGLWRVGINGGGYAYGTIFHKNIAQVFFDAASDSSNPIHRRISQAIPKGRESLEGVIRENIFMPFLSRESEKYTSGQILAMAKGITVWTRAMSEFFALIPSLLRDPEKICTPFSFLPNKNYRLATTLTESNLTLRDVMTLCYSTRTNARRDSLSSRAT